MRLVTPPRTDTGPSLARGFQQEVRAVAVPSPRTFYILDRTEQKSHQNISYGIITPLRTFQIHAYVHMPALVVVL